MSSTRFFEEAKLTPDEKSVVAFLDLSAKDYKPWKLAFECMLEQAKQDIARNIKILQHVTTSDRELKKKISSLEARFAEKANSLQTPETIIQQILRHKDRIDSERKKDLERIEAGKAERIKINKELEPLLAALREIATEYYKLIRSNLSKEICFSFNMRFIGIAAILPDERKEEAEKEKEKEQAQVDLDLPQDNAPPAENKEEAQVDLLEEDETFFPTFSPRKILNPLLPNEPLFRLHDMASEPLSPHQYLAFFDALLADSRNKSKDNPEHIKKLHDLVEKVLINKNTPVPELIKKKDNKTYFLNDYHSRLSQYETPKEDLLLSYQELTKKFRNLFIEPRDRDALFSSIIDLSDLTSEVMKILHETTSSVAAPVAKI